MQDFNGFTSWVVSKLSQNVKSQPRFKKKTEKSKKIPRNGDINRTST